MLIKKVSLLTGRVNMMDIPVTDVQIARWQNTGVLIQEAFPQLNADQREFLLSGATPDEWDEAFKEDNES